MIRVAFTLIGGKKWTGGYNYLLNLVRILVEHAPSRVQPVLFFGTDAGAVDLAPFAKLAGAQVLQTAEFDESRRGQRLREALLTGCDRSAARRFAEHRIDVVFEPAQFYGWRFPVPALAWMPDFQHRHLRHLFGFGGFWKRELGFRAQVHSNRHIMLSSEDARRDCEAFFPRSVGHTSVVRNAVTPHDNVDYDGARAIADSYGLPENFFFLPNQFWVHKNHAVVIDALELLRASGHDLVLAVTGKQDDSRDPAHFPALAERVAQLSLKQKFRMLGLLPLDHVHALMRVCTALINPSLFEGWSTTVEEAKSMGTPMILSDLAVHREQAEGQADFFDPNSAECLAEIFRSFIPLSRRERDSRSQAASVQAYQRVEEFADCFGAALQRAMDTYRA